MKTVPQYLELSIPLPDLDEPKAPVERSETKFDVEFALPTTFDDDFVVV
jgi:hypothetical protein